MKAKIITFHPSSDLGPLLSVQNGNHFEPHGTVQHVAHIPQPGIICQLKLGAAGLQYCRAGVTTHVIPREQLIALFEKLEPKFASHPPISQTKPKEVDTLGAPATWNP